MCSYDTTMVGGKRQRDGTAILGNRHFKRGFATRRAERLPGAGSWDRSEQRHARLRAMRRGKALGAALDLHQLPWLQYQAATQPDLIISCCAYATTSLLCYQCPAVSLRIMSEAALLQTAS